MRAVFRVGGPAGCESATRRSWWVLAQRFAARGWVVLRWPAPRCSPESGWALVDGERLAVEGLMELATGWGLQCREEE